MASQKDPGWKLHDSFMKAYRELQATRGRFGQSVENEGYKQWAEVKQKGDAEIADKTREFKLAAEKIRNKSNILGFLKKAAQSSQSSSSNNNDVDVVQVEPMPESTSQNSLSGHSEEEEPEDSEGAPDAKRPKQEKLEKEIRELQIEKEVRTRQGGTENAKRMREVKELINSKQAMLKRIKAAQVRVSEFRKRKKLEQPEPKRRGRPTLESSGVNVKDAIEDYFVSMAPSAADGKRRTERLEACLTLDKLQEALLVHYDYEIKRSTLYTRLLPRNSATHEGKRHHSCAEVRLLRPQNDLMAKHTDGHFATATIRYMKDFAILMGAECVCFMSQDDKARVPLGIPAVHKQVRMAMHLQYKVSLPDHDWVIAERHKLIPSVYAGCVVGTKAVTPNGPTFIAVRSGKHDSSTARTHLTDFFKLSGLEVFRELCIMPNGKFKPNLLVTVDGGPDESPRFPKTLLAWAKVFQHMDIDYLMVATHAPGQSAFNAVERRMAPLSKALTGLILPYDTFGTHLDPSGKTVDDDLEQKNFEAAGKILADIWSTTVIADNSVSAEWVSPLSATLELSTITEKWKRAHVLQTRYSLQIRKCEDVRCCGRARTCFRALLGDGLLPPPVPFVKTPKGPQVAPEDVEGHFSTLQERMSLWNLAADDMAFDSHCPSMAPKVKALTCSTCKQYHPTKKALLDHRKAKICGTFDTVTAPQEIELIDSDDEGENAANTTTEEPTVPIVDDHFDLVVFGGIEEESAE